MTTKYEQSMMQNLYWWGIPTLFRCPNKPLKSQDIALIGVPHSTGNGTTERDQHLGPRAVRNISSLQRRVHKTFKFDPNKDTQNQQFTQTDKHIFFGWNILRAMDSLLCVML